MADNTNNIRGAIETNQASADTMLSSLPGKVVNHGKHAVAGVLAGLAMAVSSPAFAGDVNQVAVSNSTTLQSTGIASNGMKFADIEKMSPEERKAQPVVVRIEFNKWKKEQLDQAAIEDNLRIEGKKQEVVSLKEKVNDTNLIKTILQVNANGNSAQTISELRTKLMANDNLRLNPILKDFCKDYIDGKCPPIQQQYLIAINTWLKTV